jgi:hypothetical protein
MRYVLEDEKKDDIVSCCVICDVFQTQFPENFKKIASSMVFSPGLVPVTAGFGSRR